MGSRNNMEVGGILVPIVIVAVIGFWVLSSSFVVVDSGHVGVVRTLGAVQTNELKEGFHLVKPFIDRVEQMDCRLHRALSKANAASKDLQNVSTEVTVQFAINGDVAPATYQSIGDKDEVSVKLIEPAIHESVKSVTARFTAEELVTQRSQVKLEIHEQISEFIRVTLEKKGTVGAVNIANVAITDFDFSDEFNRAIEMKVKAEQEALQAKNVKLQRVTQAEAKAAEMTLDADAVAYKIEMESKSRADAIKREAEALKGNPELIELRAVEKWDGQLPRFSGGGNAIPMLDLGQIMKNEPGQP